MSRTVIGVDPGITGAIAVIRDGKLREVHDMPVHMDRADGKEIARILCRFDGDVVVFVEHTQPMPKNGSIASFKLGLNTGVVLGAVQALGFPLRRPRPMEWKKSNGLINKDKAASRGLARELWPSFADQFKLVKHDGRAEACLIARHGLVVLMQEANV